MNHFLRASAGIAAMEAVLTVAYAQAQDQAPPGPQGTPPTAEQRAAWIGRLHQAARAKALHDVLNLRPDQEAAFRALQAAMASTPHGDHQGHMDQAAGALTTAAAARPHGRHDGQA